MKASFFALTVVAAGLAGCAAGPAQPSANPFGSAREAPIDGPGLFGDLRWNVEMGGKKERVSAAPANAAEQEEFKKWQESAGSTERKEFEDWRAWQEWKRSNPK
jgi:hypothetical protein